MKLIKELINNRKVVFDTGKFDDWCVYVVEENGSRKAPFDVEYFTDLKKLSTHYSNNKEEAENITSFFVGCGLGDLVKDKKVKNLVGYATGVEVGLDSNGRKKEEAIKWRMLSSFTLMKFV